MTSLAESETMSDGEISNKAVRSPGHCEHKWRLLSEVADAIKWLNSLESARTRALIRDDQRELRRVEADLEDARQLKEDVWDALLGHVTVHGC